MGRDVTDMGLNVTDVGYEKKESKKELKKHAATIHCSNSLSLLQRKITNALMYHAYKELMSKRHEITVKQLCRLIGYKAIITLHKRCIQRLDFDGHRMELD